MKLIVICIMYRVHATCIIYIYAHIHMLRMLALDRLASMHVVFVLLVTFKNIYCWSVIVSLLPYKFAVCDLVLFSELKTAMDDYSALT